MTGPRFNANLLKVPLYIAGRAIEEVKEEYNLDNVIKMGSNENPVGPSPHAKEAVNRVLDEAHRYPGVAVRDLRRELATKLGNGLKEGNILIGNGGTDILRIITQGFVFDGGNTIMSRTTFPLYHIFTTAFGGEPRQVDPTPDYGHDLAAMIDEIDEDTRIVYLCSPNNPSGHIITQSDADNFMERIPEHVVVVFDESYRDYITDPDSVQCLNYIEEGLNVLSVHSFSKSSGLANMRVGYLIGCEGLIQYLHHARLPFHTGDIALAAATGSLHDHEFQAQQRQVVIESREHLHSKLCQMGLTCLPSQANFIVIDRPPMGALTLTESMLRRGIILREMSQFGMQDAVRISVGSPSENEFFLDMMEELLTGD
jgi:histidinol-phosphate aminotransferase